SGTGPPEPGGVLRRGLGTPGRAAGRGRGRNEAPAVPGARGARGRGLPEVPPHGDVPDDAGVGPPSPRREPVPELTPIRDGRRATVPSRLLPRRGRRQRPRRPPGEPLAVPAGRG